MSRPAAFLRLVRLPSVLTVPGDVLLGAAWATDGEEPATVAALALSSSLLYLGGMALNDWADRELDARERPWRPIPAGELAPATALGSAVVLTGGALAVAGGVRRLRGVLALAATVWLYDLKAKDTPAGPWTMAVARALDVLAGVNRHPLRAGPPAAVAGAHALLITLVSAREVEGAGGVLASRALLGVVVTTALAATLIVSGRRSSNVALALACLALYGWAMGRAGVAALRRPGPAGLQRLVGAGVLANMPLQAALLAGRGRRVPAVALVAAWPAARWAARRTAVT